MARGTQAALVALLSAALVLFWTAPLRAQSLVSGSVTGTVTDPTGAVVPNATVSLKNNATGQTLTQSTNSSGVYRFQFLTPGTYTLSATAQNFKPSTATLSVSVGQTTTNNMTLALSSASQTVTVTSEAPIIQTENGNVSTTFTPAQVALVPNPGNDLSYIPQTSPGAKMNTQSGYGNFSTFGLPGTSNVFTMNGMNDNDPFLNVNNSGATNLLLGQNDVQEVTVVNNGYSGQYGGLAGANVNYVSKSGSNNWHGNAEYFWNGRILNANNYFNKHTTDTITPRPFDNVNQWAASLGGPIKKDKTFFFVDTEGVRIVLPTVTPTNIPSPQFEAATLANLPALGNAAEIPFYQKIFSLYNSAPGANRAANILPGGGCADLTTLPGFGATGSPCALQFQSNAGNFTHEWQLVGRIDQVIGSNDKAFIRFQTDHGVQATFTDPINPVFNAVSTQPEYQGQINETHTFGANAVNQFVGSLQWYSALFAPTSLNKALTTFPTTLDFASEALTALGGLDFIWPQGRNVTSYQITDDLSWTRGNHNFKFGVNFHRNNVSDHDFGFFSSGETLGSESMTDFFNGNATSFIQSFPTSLNQPVALYGLGAYIQDEWRVSNTLKLTLALRADHDSNPVCQLNCFARFNSPSFFAMNHDSAIPYNQIITSGLHQALPGLTQVAWGPRFGFAWQLPHMGSTVLRGGFGIFYDQFPGAIADNVSQNSPLDNTFVTGGVPLAPGVPGNMFDVASGSNAAFVSGFRNGGTLASISAAVPTFAPPSFYNVSKISLPRYQEWNLELQKGLGAHSSMSINYVGNHGIFEPNQDYGVNAFCPPSTCAAGFQGLPSAAPDSRFGTVANLYSNAVSNYNGVTVTVQRKFTNGLQLQGNYTYSHALDEISNGGFLPFSLSPATNTSYIFPQDPNNLRAYNYGNADYDTRHYFSANYVYDVPYRSGPAVLLKGWTISGTFFVRSGLPFTAIDTAAGGALSSNNYGAPSNIPIALFASPINAGSYVGLERTCNNPDTPCLNTSSFLPAGSLLGFGNQRRNQFRGPGFFDTDFTVMKQIPLPGWEQGKLRVGAQFFNLINHPNFDQPVNDISSAQFGTINRTVSVPTSIVGSFLGGDASPRMIQLTARLTF
ncbi:MAG TPA: carboxypeptidase regulatory-like domain-containing protein [Terriglobales bacterium]|nr:carboxypeptidase regulatory-like domain-containing protein [Terriglobales bacterium]